MVPASSGKSVLVVPDVNVLMNIHYALRPQSSLGAFSYKAIAANNEANKLRASDLMLSGLGNTDASLAAVAVAVRGEFEGFPVSLHSGTHIRDTFLHKTPDSHGQNRWGDLEAMFFSKEGQMDWGERSAANHPPLDYEDGKVNGLANYYAGQHVFDDVVILTCDRPLVKTYKGLRPHRGVFVMSPQAFLSRQLSHLARTMFAAIPLAKRS